jgi:hypothetical protein
MLHVEITMGRLYMAYWKSSWEKLEEVIKREMKGELGRYPKGVKSLGNWVTPDITGFELLEVEDEKALFEYIRQWLPWMTKEDVFPVLNTKDYVTLRTFIPKE